MSHRPVGVGIIGCGAIFPQYLRGCRQFEILALKACADADPEQSKTRAAEFGLDAVEIDSMLNDPTLELIINLTPPRAHAEVSQAILKSGKHLYSEKPLATTRDEARQVLDLAQTKGLRVGCAPDTVLGGGLQTCRRLIDDGWIGRPLGATAFFISRGPEGSHPRPDRYYQLGGGPLSDAGCYALISLVTFLGPITSVTAHGKKSFEERVIAAGDRRGERIHVEVDTYVSASMEFENGAVGTFVATYDVWGSSLPFLEVYGTEGSLSAPDPDRFDGSPRLLRAVNQTTNQSEQPMVWSEIPPLVSTNVGRGIGAADLAYGIRSGREHRATGELGFHFVDIIASIGESIQTGQRTAVASRPARPAPLPLGLLDGQLD